MQPGDLVEITRASVGIPAGTVALIIEKYETGASLDDWQATIFVVWPTGEVGKRGARRYLARDLDVISRPLKSKLVAPLQTEVPGKNA